MKEMLKACMSVKFQRRDEIAAKILTETKQ